MAKRWNRCSDIVHGPIQTIRNEHARFIAGLGDDQSPWIDDERPAVAGSIRAVVATLGRGDDKSLALDRTRPEEYLPVVFARFPGESARHSEPPCLTLDEPAIEFRKTQVVTDRQANDSEGRRRRHDFLTRFEMEGFPVAVFAIWPERHVEEVDLSVARDLDTLWREHQAGVVDALIPDDLLWKSPAQQPDPMTARPIGKAAKNLTVASLCTGKGFAFAAHIGKIFRQGDEGRSALRRLEDSPLSGIEVGSEIIGRAKLNDSNADSVVVAHAHPHASAHEMPVPVNDGRLRRA